MITQLEQIISNGESQTIEFKKSLTQLKSTMETLCGFLNSEGGIAIIGVNQHGKMVGQKVTDNTQQEIAKEIAKIEPLPSSLNIEYVTLIEQKDHKIIVASIDRGDAIPYTYNGRAFYRNQSSTMRMPQSRYAQLLMERSMQSDNTWETQLVEGATIDDLDHEEIRRTIRIATNINRLSTGALNESIENILIKLELMKENKLTNAAMALFAKSFTFNFTQCLIKLARFRGTTELGEFIDSQMIDGNAFEIMKAANDFNMRHLPVASFFNDSKLERIDKPILPVLAIREALSNALCHRDYSIHNGAITLAIFDDRLEIWNNGLLPSFLTIDDLKKSHKSHPRNKRMAKIFYLRGYIESWGTGTTKMIELCRQNDDPEPMFDEYSGGFSVTFRFREPIGCSVKETPDEFKNITEISHNYLLNDSQKEIFNLIKKYHALTVSNILANLSNPPSGRMVRKNLDVLRQKGLIRLEGYGKNAIWILNTEENQ